MHSHRPLISTHHRLPCHLCTTTGQPRHARGHTQAPWPPWPRTPHTPPRLLVQTELATTKARRRQEISNEVPGSGLEPFVPGEGLGQLGDLGELPRHRGQAQTHQHTHMCTRPVPTCTCPDRLPGLSQLHCLLRKPNLDSWRPETNWPGGQAGWGLCRMCSETPSAEPQPCP